jgi:hypothetical protein
MNELIEKMNELKVEFKIDYSKEVEVLEKEIKVKMDGKLYKSVKDIDNDIKKLSNLINGKVINYNYKKGVNVGVGDMVKGLLLKGISNDVILKQVCEKYGNENTTKSCISWYKNDMKKKGLIK